MVKRHKSLFTRLHVCSLHTYSMVQGVSLSSQGNQFQLLSLKIRRYSAQFKFDMNTHFMIRSNLGTLLFFSTPCAIE